MNSIKNRRDSAGISQSALAISVGVSPQAVSLWEKGESDPKWDLGPIIAKALGCSIADLLEEPDDHRREPLSPEKAAIVARRDAQYDAGSLSM